MDSTVIVISPDSISALWQYISDPAHAAALVDAVAPTIGRWVARGFGFLCGMIAGVGAGIGFLRGWPV